MIPVSRRIREAGFDRYLSGFGIGSHMAYLEDLVALLGWLPCSKTSLKVWKLARTRQLRWLGGLEHLHPGFALPNFRQYYLLLCLLRHYGVVENVSEFYTRQMRALVTDALAPVSCEHCDGTPLIDVLRQHSWRCARLVRGCDPVGESLARNRHGKDFTGPLCVLHALCVHAG